MRLAVTGGTGLVGRFIVAEALSRGAEVTILSRNAPPPGLFDGVVRHLPWRLGETARLVGMEGLVHAAFDHVPGRYRGGEGADPEGFLRRNVDGSLALIEDARRAGVSRTVFLSSRAVYGAYPAGTDLTEDLPPRPDTLYGKAKRIVEEALVQGGLPSVSLRATGVYGAFGRGLPHKWDDLFRQFRDGAPISPRRGTEVHGRDLASAVWLALTGAGVPPVLNVSDLLLDRRDLLAEVQRLTGWTGRLPPPSDAPVSVMACKPLHALGWRPGGWDLLVRDLAALLDGVMGAPAQTRR